MLGQEISGLTLVPLVPCTDTFGIGTLGTRAFSFFFYFLGSGTQGMVLSTDRNYCGTEEFFNDWNTDIIRFFIPTFVQLFCNFRCKGTVLQLRWSPVAASPGGRGTGGLGGLKAFLSKQKHFAKVRRK